MMIRRSTVKCDQQAHGEHRSGRPEQACLFLSSAAATSHRSQGLRPKACASRPIGPGRVWVVQRLLWTAWVSLHWWGCRWGRDGKIGRRVQWKAFVSTCLESPNEFRETIGEIYSHVHDGHPLIVSSIFLFTARRSKDASDKEIRQQYHELSKKRYIQTRVATPQNFKVLIKAYKSLTDDETKKWSQQGYYLFAVQK